MKKFLALALAVIMLLALTACEAKPAENPAPAETSAPETPATEAPAVEEIELTVFAAASLTETITELASMYEDAHPGVKVICNFDSSGTLKTQIQEGADCDVFISAGQKQMNQLDINASAEVNTDGLDLVLAGSRVDLLENKIALVVPEGNPAGVESFDMLAERLADGSVFMAMGNNDVPVGQYTQKIFAYYNLNEENLANSLSYGTNVKEVTTQVSEAAVDCGIVYATDAFSAGLTVVDTAVKDRCGLVIYPAAVMNVSKNAAEAQSFLDFLQTAEAIAVFEAVGFSPVK